MLADHGLAGALRAVQRRFPTKISVTEASDRRFPQGIEAAFHHCCVEAMQNAATYAGPDAHTTIRSQADSHQLEVTERSRLQPASAPGGMELQKMRDRPSAVSGPAEIVSRPGRGRWAKATVPLETRAP